jgi:hypothetical protein
MKSGSRIRTLAFAAMAASGCAGAQHTETAPPRAQPVHMTPSVLPQQRCLTERRTRIQDCIIEGLATMCRQRASGNEDAYDACMTSGLDEGRVSGARALTTTVSAGDEVFSLRMGGIHMLDVIRLEATTIDQSGVAFTFQIERLSVDAADHKTQVEQAQIRMNYDGTKSGDWWKLRILDGVWNLRVEASGSSARVSFETDYPSLVVRTGR